MYKYNTFQNSSIPVRNSRGKVCGEIDGDTLRKRVKFSKHFLKKYQGFAWDCEIISRAEKKNVERIEIKDSEYGHTYRTTLLNFKENGIEIDFGYGRQIVCPLKKFERIG